MVRPPRAMHQQRDNKVGFFPADALNTLLCSVISPLREETQEKTPFAHFL